MNVSIKGGEEASRDASDSFKEIAASTAQTLQISEDILNASKHQIDDIKNVVSITESVVVIAEETAAGTEEIASSASELSSGMSNHAEKADEVVKIVQDLQNQLNNFKLANRKSVFLTVANDAEEESSGETSFQA